MADVLKRWDGTTWQVVASVNRVELAQGDLLTESNFSVNRTAGSPVGGWNYLTTVTTSSIATF